MKGSSRNDVVDFTRGVMDRIRDHIRQNFPESWSVVEETKTSVGTKLIKSGDAVMVIKNAKVP